MTRPTDATRSGANARAILRWGDKSGGQYALHLLEGDTAQLGREAGNEVRLDSTHVSRRHAVISWRDAHFEIADLGSTNGTLVNGEPISRPRKLQDADVIRLYDIDVTFQEVKQAVPLAQPGVTGTFVVLPSTPQPRLIISAGAQEGREIFLRGKKMVIGRATAKDAWDIALLDRAISRPHAQVEQKDDGFVLTDLGSANGTIVNGAAVGEPIPLKDGDVIALGETTLLFRDK